MRESGQTDLAPEPSHRLPRCGADESSHSDLVLLPPPHPCLYREGVLVNHEQGRPFAWAHYRDLMLSRDESMCPFPATVIAWERCTLVPITTVTCRGTLWERVCRMGAPQAFCGGDN